MYAAFKQGEYAVMVMEYANGGDLLQLMERYRRRLPEQTASLIMSQVGCRRLPEQTASLIMSQVGFDNLGRMWHPFQTFQTCTRPSS